jgi:DNA-binding winged helix-turn-helix (wHTH) protein
MEQECIFRFGRFLLDARRHTLVKDGEQIHLTPKAFDVLVELLSAGGCVVSKNELITKVWANSCVEESNLSQSIWMLRRVLEDRSENGARHYISTIWGRGYKIVADVTRVNTGSVSTLHVGTLARSEDASYDSHARQPESMPSTAAVHNLAINRLTPTERRVLQLIADNRTSRQIADSLGISVRTVENHRARIRTKLGITGSNSLLRFALEHKWEIRAAAGEC